MKSSAIGKLFLLASFTIIGGCVVKVPNSDAASGAGAVDQATTTQPLKAAQVEASSMENFSLLVGGRWQSENIYHRFSWGADEHKAIMETYVVTELGEKRVTDGFWYFDPIAKNIKGVFFYHDNPLQFSEYRSHFEGNRLVSRFNALAKDGSVKQYQEVWVLSESELDWTLYEVTEVGVAPYATEVFSRVAD